MDAKSQLFFTTYAFAITKMLRYFNNFMSNVALYLFKQFEIIFLTNKLYKPEHLKISHLFKKRSANLENFCYTTISRKI